MSKSGAGLGSFFNGAVNQPQADSGLAGNNNNNNNDNGSGYSLAPTDGQVRRNDGYPMVQTVSGISGEISVEHSEKNSGKKIDDDQREENNSDEISSNNQPAPSQKNEEEIKEYSSQSQSSSQGENIDNSKDKENTSSSSSLNVADESADVNNQNKDNVENKEVLCSSSSFINIVQDENGGNEGENIGNKEENIGGDAPLGLPSSNDSVVHHSEPEQSKTEQEFLVDINKNSNNAVNSENNESEVDDQPSGSQVSSVNNKKSLDQSRDVASSSLLSNAIALNSQSPAALIALENIIKNPILNHDNEVLSCLSMIRSMIRSMNKTEVKNYFEKKPEAMWGIVGYIVSNMSDSGANPGAQGLLHFIFEHKDIFEKFIDFPPFEIKNLDHNKQINFLKLKEVYAAYHQMWSELGNVYEKVVKLDNAIIEKQFQIENDQNEIKSLNGGQDFGMFSRLGGIFSQNKNLSQLEHKDRLAELQDKIKKMQVELKKLISDKNSMKHVSTSTNKEVANKLFDYFLQNKLVFEPEYIIPLIFSSIAILSFVNHDRMKKLHNFSVDGKNRLIDYPIKMYRDSLRFVN
ncbi:hypothetical protein [Paraburkholderia bonniea]|uniref:hypothetical protein n=1 Tax=Paraburkholderia bonniea TaxID=2152891 RepID=UPI001290F4AD|nr:hypothetical protein [Paraburkholderia bonniea]